MKATLTFNLPEDREEFEIAQNGIRYLSALEEIKNLLRNEVKYGGVKNVPELYTEICIICGDVGII